MTRKNYKVIEAFPDYMVNPKGKVYSTLTKKVLKPQKNGVGYLIYRLMKNGKPHTVTAHRLVAEAFIPTDDYTKVVNHKDENRKNNRVENLEWITHGENCAYSTKPTGMEHKYPVGKSGERYIHFINGNYRVIIERKNFRRSASFPLLEQAIAYRREVLGA